MVWCKTNFAKVATDCTYYQMYMYTEGKIQTPTRQKLFGRSMTAPPPMLSLSSTLPPYSFHCNLIPSEKHSSRVS